MLVSPVKTSRPMFEYGILGGMTCTGWCHEYIIQWINWIWLKKKKRKEGEEQVAAGWLVMSPVESGGVDDQLRTVFDRVVVVV